MLNSGFVPSYRVGRSLKAREISQGDAAEGLRGRLARGAPGLFDLRRLALPFPVAPHQAS